MEWMVDRPALKRKIIGEALCFRQIYNQNSKYPRLGNLTTLVNWTSSIEAKFPTNKIRYDNLITSAMMAIKIKNYGLSILSILH